MSGPTLPPEGVILEPQPPKRPVDFAEHVPDFFEKDRAKLRRRLPCGPHWQIADAITWRMLTSPDGPELEEDLEELRRDTTLSAEDFAEAYPLVRSRAPFVREGGRIRWQTAVNARAYAERKTERMEAVSLLGGYSNGVFWAARRLVGKVTGRAAEKELSRFAHCLHRQLEQRKTYYIVTGKFGRLDSLDKLRRMLKSTLLSMAKAGEVAKARLDDVAAVLKIDRREVDRLWRTNPAWARDLAIRHRLGVLSYSTLRRLLLGQPLVPCDWPRAFEAPELPPGIAQGL